MNIEFATNDPAIARRYLDTGDTAYMSDELKDAVIAGVEAGAWRVRDPHMYGGSPDMVRTTSNPRQTWDEHMKTVQVLHARDWAARKAKEQA